MTATATKTVWTVDELMEDAERRRAMRTVPIEGRPTWQDLVDREPMLQDLLDDAKATHHECWSCRFYGVSQRGIRPRLPGLKSRVCDLVGFGSHHENPALHTSAAYDTVYQTVLHAIPDTEENTCRWCGEPCA